MCHRRQQLVCDIFRIHKGFIAVLVSLPSNKSSDMIPRYDLIRDASASISGVFWDGSDWHAIISNDRKITLKPRLNFNIIQRLLIYITLIIALSEMLLDFSLDRQINSTT